MEIWALLVWLLVIVLATLVGSVKFLGYEIESIPMRMLASTATIIIFSFVCWVLGFVGNFLFSPILYFF